MGFCTWHVRGLYKAGSLSKLARELVRYNVDLVGVQEVKWYRWGTLRAGDYIFFYGKGKSSISKRIDEWKTNLMSFAILFRLCAQHVSDINISVFRSLRLCWWITTSVVFFSVRCVLEFLLRLIFGGVRFAGWSLQNEHHQISTATKTPTHNELRTRRQMW